MFSFDFLISSRKYGNINFFRFYSEKGTDTIDDFVLKSLWSCQAEVCFQSAMWRLPGYTLKVWPLALSIPL